jgi:acetyl-CoA carboxylase/biotin carboxylase 1
MKAKGAIREVLVWENARPFFYWRLRRRLAEDAARLRFAAASPHATDEAVTQMLQRAMSARMGATAVWGDDQAVAAWLEADAANLARMADEEARREVVASAGALLRSLDPIARRAAIALGEAAA